VNAAFYIRFEGARTNKFEFHVLSNNVISRIKYTTIQPIVQISYISLLKYF